MSFIKKITVAVIVSLTFLSGGTKSLMGLAAQADSDRGHDSNTEGHGATCEA